eukprot:scaffold5434_cov310-Cylindrotheca_fusiformis.AAC.1
MDTKTFRSGSSVGSVGSGASVTSSRGSMVSMVHSGPSSALSWAWARSSTSSPSTSSTFDPRTLCNRSLRTLCNAWSEVLSTQNIIKNCKVTEEDVDLGRKIYGPSAAMMPSKENGLDPGQRSWSLRSSRYPKPFMSSIDRDIWFRKVVPLKSRSVDNMFGAMDE